MSLASKSAGEPFEGWWVSATCPDCGARLAHTADGVPNGYRSRAVARCTGECGRAWAVQITLADASKELGRRRGSHPDGCICVGCSNTHRGRTHGTVSCYNAGCRCGDCTRAGTAAKQAWRDRTRRKKAS